MGSTRVLTTEGRLFLRRIIVLLSSVGLLLALTGSALASQPAVHFTGDVTGDTFQCDAAVYTVTSGTISIVVHEGAAASGNENFTLTITPRKVVAVDEAGNQYSIVGAIWFGGDHQRQHWGRAVHRHREVPDREQGHGHGR